jgi:hypothetical protein
MAIPADFNWQMYIQLNPDITRYGYTGEEGARRHYLKYGQAEGRPYIKPDVQIPVDFDWKTYLKLNPDLYSGGVTSEQLARRHYMLYGQQEGRQFFDPDAGIKPEQFASFDVSSGFGLDKLQQLRDMGATEEQVRRISQRAPFVGTEVQRQIPEAGVAIRYPGDEQHLANIPINTSVARPPDRPAFASAVSQQDLDAFIRSQLARAQQAQQPVDYTQRLAPSPNIPVTPPEPLPTDQAPAGFSRGGSVDAFIRNILAKKFADGGPSSGVRRLEMSGYQDGGEVSDNRFAQMVEEERAAQDKAFDSVNRQLSDLLERYKEGNEGITEKDLLPFFPGYNEYDIAQMYGTTTESSIPSMSSKARSFTPEIMSNLRKYDELMQKDFDSLVKEKRLPRDVMTARTLGLANGGEVTNDEFIQEMLVGTRPEDQEVSKGLLPPELREAIDVPLDLANLAVRGTAAAVAGPAYGLYKGLTSEDFGTKKGVTEARSEAERMMGEITGEPKTQAGKDIMQFVGEKLEAAKIPPMPQFLTTPVPGPGAASALMRSYELAETPPLGTVKLAGDKGVKPATPPTDQMGFYSPAEKAVMGLPQDKGTASQMLAQITKTQGVKPVELRATGLEDYLKGKGNEPVTKQEIQDFLTNNRVQVDEVVLGKGQTLSPEAKKLSGEAMNRMEAIDNKLASYFEGVEEVAGQDSYSAFIMLRSSIGRKAAKGDQEALDELNAFNLPPEIKDLVLEFGRNKNEYIKYTSQARKMEKPKFDRYNTPGGQNAREIYLTLPGEQMPSSLPPSVNAQGVLVKPMDATQPKFTAPSPHSVSPEADANRLAHIFLDERKDAKGNNVLFVQEMQSDWAQQGRDKGFAIVNKLPEGYSVKQDLIVSGQPWGVVDKNGQFVTAGFHRSKEDAVAEVIQRLNTYKLPTAPFVTNTEDWVNLALKRVIKEAVDNDIDTVAFIKGGQAADKYSLRTFVDYISADRKTTSGVEHLPGATDDLYVFIAPKDSLSHHAFYVGPDGIIKEPISADVRSKFLGEPLSKVIGKETAEKLLSTKIGESQVLRDEGLTLGGKGMEGFYDNILPKTAEKLLKKLGGGKVEPVQLEFGELQLGAGAGRHSTVKENYLGFKITPEMKEMVKTEGLPKFAAGGEVTDFIKRAA